MTTGLALIARADSGGLGHLSWEIARHLRPDRIAVAALGNRGRGPVHLERFSADRTTVIRWPDAGPEPWETWIAGLADVGVRTLLSAETFYEATVPETAARYGIETVLYAMPELLAADRDPALVADRTYLPTSWEADRFTVDGILPTPVATDRLHRRVRRQARRFLHVAAPAMLDRNGTRLVLDALPYVESEIEVVIVGAPETTERRVGSVHVIEQRDGPDLYWDLYETFDALLLPRRYAGLSLPIWEAHASGLPVISLDLDPQRGMLDPLLLVDACRPVQTRMKGGYFDVWDARPRDLAAAIDRLATASEETVASVSLDGLAWGDANAWSRLRPLWLETLLPAEESAA